MDVKQFANTVKGVEIFAPGTHNGDTYTDRDLDAIIAAAADLDFKPALKLGHTKDKPGDPAYGYVENLRKSGGKLLADFTHVHDDILDAMRKRNFDRVSAEIFFNLKRAGKVFPRALKAVALLGSEIPAVAGLKPLHTLEFAANSAEAVKSFDVPLNVPVQALADSLAARVAGLSQIFEELQDMDPKLAEQHAAELKATRETVEKLTTQLKAFTDNQSTEAQARKAELDTAMRRVAELEAARTADAVKAKVAAIVIPSFRPAFEALFSHAMSVPAGTKVKVYSADGKSEDKTLVEVLDVAVASINETGRKLGSLMALSGRAPRAEGSVETFENPSEEVDAKVKKHMQEKGEKSYEKALSFVLDSDKDLAGRYRDSQGKPQ